MNPNVDGYFEKLDQWNEELELLRSILLDSPLTEDYKWSSPIYTLNNANIIGIGPFKEFCALSFFKGSLLGDTHKLLLKIGQNTQHGRWIKFTNVEQIRKLEPILKEYIYEAYEIEKSGAKVEYKKTEDYPIPEEFQVFLDKNAKLKAAFENLTPGRQRAYLLHFAQPKQSATRTSRVEKCIPLILEGKGLNEDYLEGKRKK